MEEYIVYMDEWQDFQIKMRNRGATTTDNEVYMNGELIAQIRDDEFDTVCKIKEVYVDLLL